eukprot:GFUD01038270.1.p1 GENE.GFUD01038270.1~~GFUD01038270.1.p1  ORF type:complete len:309 (-),score=87.92 GFUD01038270.1:31-957(-)
MYQRITCCAKDTSHAMKILLVFLLLHCSSGFLITEAEPGVIRVSPGDTVTLFCAVDDDYEWCKFYHPSGRFCDFEWKRSESNITMQTCGLSDRVSFHGKYDDRECGITFTANEGDTGIWKCEIEEYVTWRSRGAGRVETAQMNVTVHTPTTQATVETTTTTMTTVLSSEQTKAVQTTQSTPTIVDSKSSATVKKLDDEHFIESPEAVPRVDKNQNAGGSSSALIGVFAAIIIAVVAVSGVIYYRKRKNSSTAAAVYSREAKLTHDQTNMVRNSNSNLTFHSNNAENSNLHEYYPPNLTYSTVTPESEA